MKTLWESLRLWLAPEQLVSLAGRIDQAVAEAPERITLPGICIVAMGRTHARHEVYAETGSR